MSNRLHVDVNQNTDMKKCSVLFKLYNIKEQTKKGLKGKTMFVKFRKEVQNKQNY